MSAADVSVVVATFGDYEKWNPLAQRAVRSAERQILRPAKIVRSHMDTLALARNVGALRTSTEYILFCDGDDELDRDYIRAMMAAKGDIRRPSTLGIVSGVEDDAPVMIPRRPLEQGNFIVIGAMMRRDQFLKVGGFDELPISEDWDLWCKLYLDGAEIVDVPEAVYRVHVAPQSRNSDAKMGAKVYNLIRNRYKEAFRAHYREHGGQG